MILKKYCLLLMLVMNIAVVASEKATHKQEKYDSMKSLHAYLDDLEIRRLQKKYTTGINFQHGSNYVGVNNNEILHQQRFGRGSSDYIKSNL